MEYFLRELLDLLLEGSVWRWTVVTFCSYPHQTVRDSICL